MFFADSAALKARPSVSVLFLGRLEECGRRRLCLRGHRLHVFLKRFSFLKGVLYGRRHALVGNLLWNLHG